MSGVVKISGPNGTKIYKCESEIEATSLYEYLVHTANDHTKLHRIQRELSVSSVPFKVLEMAGLDDDIIELEKAKMNYPFNSDDKK